MTARTSAQALADVASALVEDHETAGVLARLLRDCADLLPADAAAVLVRTPAGMFELLAATSHRVEEIELYQAQAEHGPCVDAAVEGRATGAVGAADMVARWGDVGREIVASGFGSVHAFPMHWRGHTIGGLNVFTVDETELPPASSVLAQSFADFATLAIVRPAKVDEDDLAQRINDALEGRIIVEQAKGVLAQRLGLDMGAAYDELVARTEATGQDLAAAARQVVRDAHTR